MKKLYVASLLLLAFFLHNQVSAQISLTTANGSYSENFDGMGATGTVLPTGWSALRLAGTGTIGAALPPLVTDGSANSGGVFNAGITAATDRALGSLASGSTIPVFGTSFINNSVSIINSITISGFSEQWRSGGSSAINENLVFEYSTNATSLNSGTWTAITTLNLVEILTTTTTSAPVNGNANRVAISGTISSINLNNGDTIWIRWRDNDDTGTDGIYALDDFQVSWTNVAVASTLSIAAGTNAAEPATNGTFTLTLSAPAPAGGVIINYTLSGTATKDVDYSNPQNGTVTIAQGNSSAILNINVTDDNISEPTETIIATLTSVSNGFSITTGAASITLSDNESSSLYAFDFNTCTGALSDGFTAQSVTGTEVWSCTTFGRTGNAVQMNGFATTSQANEDWLISPVINLTTTNIPLLSFYSRSAFSGDALKLYITTNFTGNVTTTAWTELNGVFPASGSDVWTLSQNINLSAFKQANVRFAFRYTSTVSAASRWTIDDINLINSTVAPPPSLTLNNGLIDFKNLTAGDISIGKSFAFTGDNFTSPLIITAPDKFLLSKNNLTYSKTLTYSVGELAMGQKTAYVGFSPSAANTVYSGPLSFTSTGINIQRILLKGNTYPGAATLNVVNWNVEWFGGTQGPTNNDLQEQNVKQVMEYVNADVYALLEVVDTARLGRVTRSLSGGYAYVVSDYGSLAPNASDPNYASAQKLALVYKTSVVSNVAARGLMKSSAGANSSWASGRVPFLVNTTVTKNGASKNLSFVVVHGKAGDTQSDYLSRKAGATELKDTLDTYFSMRSVIVLGDFNDDFDRSIYTGPGGEVSSYDVLIKDSVDGNSYKSPTLLFSQYGLNSTVDFADVIDHVLFTNEVASSYLPLSASLFNDIQDLTGIPDYGGTTSDHYPVLTRYFVTEISDAPLPVKLTEFTAAKQSSTVKLTWATSQEINTKEFIVEHSTDGVTFNNLIAVGARGNSNMRLSYGAIDAQPSAGNNYYRLKTVDFDGKYEYSGIVKINFSRAFTVSLSPNPASDHVLISLANNREPLMMQIVDMGGKIVKSSVLNNQVTSVPLSGLSKGLYLVKLIGSTESYTEKLIID
ncbi:MAG TPA: choice-of-anchor J domain-containing protein [Chitinophagaceae bacterium]|nr:choice-of-anchor J domain-containing protein [Chitinophagaceae bacterium]